MKYSYFVLLLFTFSFVQNATSQTTVNKNLYFNVDDYTLTNASQEILLDLVGELNSSTESSLKIIGHTDQDGSLEYNMVLSQKRANSVQEFIVSNGYSVADIELSFLGESALITNAKDQQSKQQNRRVTVIASMFNYSTVSDFTSLLNPGGDDKAVIDQRQTEEIKLSKGTNVKVPSNAFCHMDGTPLSDHNVEMTFKEAFDYTDMVDERLSTETSENILETGGMIYIEATQNGAPLKLQEGKEIELLFPEQDRKDGMELFTGVNTEDGVIWEETGKPIAVKKEEPFIQVDISSITDFVFDFQDTITIPYVNMDPYPRAQRKPYPPAKSTYTEEKYAEVYKKYEDVLAIYHSDKIEIPKRRAIWEKELLRRKGLLIQHKIDHTKAHVQKWVQYSIKKLTADYKSVSHIAVVGSLNSFLDGKVGDTKYDNLYYRNKMFKGVTKDLLNKYNVYQPHVESEPLRDFCPNFAHAINMVSRDIQDRKVELGFADQELTSRYLVRTSDLGWINCDRFLKLAEEEKMELHFADNSKGNDYYLVFKDIKSVIRPWKNSEGISFRGVPIGEEVRLVSLEVNDGDCYLAYQDLTLGSSEEIDLQFKKVKLTDVRNALENI